MSLPSTRHLPVAILETILGGLAPLFLAGASGDIANARHAASRMLDAYQPHTEDELRLAANIIGFSFQALEALAQAAAPDLPVTRTLRLRGSAVSLSREAGRAERRLVQLRKAREQATAAPTLEIHPGTAAKIEQAVAPMSPEPIPPVLAPPVPAPPALAPVPLVATASTKDTGNIDQTAEAAGVTWPLGYNQRQREARIAASLKRAEAPMAAQSTEIESGYQPMARAI